MISPHRHCTIEELQGLLDGVVDPGDTVRIRHHIDSCELCQRRYRAFGQLDGALRRFPLSSPGPMFTQTLMEKLRRSSKPGLAYRALVYVPSALGMVLVLGTMGIALLAARQSGAGPAREVQSQDFVTGFLQSLGVFTEGLAKVLTDYFPFIFSVGALRITGLVIAGLLVIAALDRLIGKRFAARVSP